MSKKNPVLIVGGGWAGLATAVELSRYNIPVTLLESAKQLGGRARRVPFTNNADNNDKSASTISVDNGQHLFLGAYDSTLSLLHTVGITEHQAFKRTFLYLTMLAKGEKNLKLKVGTLPAPLHLAKGLLTAKGLSFKERYNALKFSREMSKGQFELAEDISCLSLLKKHQQSDRIIRAIWQPLCLAALNTHAEHASAQVFLRTLRESFTHTRKDSHYLFPRQDLGSLFPEPAMDYIEKNKNSIKLATRVTALNLKNNNVVGVTAGDVMFESNHVVLATPFHITQQIIAEHQALETLNQQLLAMDSRPICTVYLQYPKKVSLGREMVGFINCTSHWAIDRATTGNKGLVSIVISGSGEHMTLDNNKLANNVADELASFYPKWPKPSQKMVIREKRATFRCSVGINKIRPGQKTTINGLLIAGDYTDTALPATIEGAVRSGIRCARAILAESNRNTESS